MDLVILAGGKGKRIQHLNKNKPKPMVKIKNKVFLDLLINHYSKFNFEKIFILVGYKSKIIKEKFDGKFRNFVNIECIQENTPLDTGGALSQIKNKIKKEFILINGDTFFDINNIEKFKKLNSNSSVGCLSLTKTKKSKNIKFNNLILDKKGYVKKVDKSPYINAGVYYFKKEIFSFIKKKKISLENEVLPKLIKLRKIKGKYFNNFFLDIGTPENLKYAKKILPKKIEKPAIFFDRDGVINHDKGYTYKFSKFKFRKNVINALKYLIKKKIYIFLVTNQGGIAKNKFSIEDFFKLHKKIKIKLLKKNIFIHDIEFCPHHPDGIIKKFKINCKCRKPSNMMIKSIEERWFYKKKKSYFIGDKIIDKIAAKKSNLKFQFVEDDILKQIKKIF